MAKTWIALLRGINVGGNNILPMAKLRSDLLEIGLDSVRTYIQSGNVVFTSSEKSVELLAKKISSCILQRHGFEPQVFVIGQEHLTTAIQKNPYSEGTKDSKSLHFFFFGRTPENPDLDQLDQLKSPTESYAIVENIFYLFAPEGVGRSKLAAKVEKCLGVSVTARNYRTIEKLIAMCSEKFSSPSADGSYKLNGQTIGKATSAVIATQTLNANPPRK